jgi:hypothetical protein
MEHPGMSAIALIVLALTLSWLAWHLVRSAPASVARVLPQPLTFIIGSLLLVLGVWGAFTAAQITQDPSDILFAMVRMYVGLWFMLAATAGLRRSEEDERYLRRLFGMIGIVMAMIIASLFLDGKQALAALQLAMIAGGFWVTLNFIRLNDRGG